MSNCITVKFLGPTNTRVARLKVSASGCKPKIFNIDNNINIDDQVIELAKAYSTRLRWPKLLSYGYFPRGEWVFTCKPL